MKIRNEILPDNYSQKIHDSIGIKTVSKMMFREGIVAPRLQLVVFLSGDGGYSDYIRIISPVMLNTLLEKTLTICLKELTTSNGAFNISDKVLSHFDISFLVSREKISDSSLEALLILKERYPSVRLIIDMDDDLFAISETHPEFDHYKSRLEKLKALINIADVLVASTSGVKRGIENQGCTPGSIEVIPNYLDDRIWKNILPNPTERERAESKEIRVLYAGTETHDDDLRLLEKPISHAADIILETTGARLSVVIAGGTRLSLKGMEVLSVPDSNRRYPDYVTWIKGLGRFDFAIAPLDLNNQLNYSKSALKYLEYSSLGLPAIFTNIEPYKAVIREGETGLLIAGNDPELWTESLVKLATNEAERIEMGKRAYQDVQERLLLSDHFFEWKEILEPPS